MRMADWVAGLPWYHPWRSSLQKANGHSTTWKRELFQNSWAQSPFAAGFSVTPEPSQSTGIRPQQLGFWTLFFWQLEESHEVPWKNTTKSVLEPMGRPWSQGFTVFIWFYMSLYFIYYSAVTCMLYDVPFLKKILFQIVLKSSCFVIFFRKDQIVSTKTEVVTWTNQTNIQTQKQLQTSGESTTSHRSRRATGAPKRTATKKRCRKRCHAKTMKWWSGGWRCVELKKIGSKLRCDANYTGRISTIP